MPTETTITREQWKTEIERLHAALKGYEVMLTHFEDVWLKQKTEQIVLVAAYAYASANKDITSLTYREKYYQAQGNLLRAAAALVNMQETPNAN